MIAVAPPGGAAFPRWRGFAAAGLALVAANAELWCAARLAERAYAEAIPLHLAGCLAALGCAALCAGRGGMTAGLARLTAITLPLLGPLVLPPVAAALLRLVVLPVREPHPDALRDALFPLVAADRLEAEAQHLAVTVAGRSDAVVPFSDILRWGAPTEQERVVALMGREYRASFAPLLRRALASPQPGLRAQAAAALAQAEARQAARLATLRRDAAAGGPEARDALARQLEAMAAAAASDPLRAAGFWAELATLSRERLAEAPADTDAAAALGRALLALGAPAKAREVLRAGLAAEPPAEPVLLTLAEVLYREGDLDGVAALVRQHRAAFEAAAALPGSRMGMALRLWLAHAGERAATALERAS